jgi:hypothetical protein
MGIYYTHTEESSRLESRFYALFRIFWV